MAAMNKSETAVCRHRGCARTFALAHLDTEECVFHPGTATATPSLSRSR